MDGCLVLAGFASVLATVTVVLWIGAVVSYVVLFVQYKGSKSQLIFSSMWLLSPNSLGADVERHRRRIAMFVGLFFLTLLLAIAASLGATGAGCGQQPA
jgi:hypothetical protein